VHGLAAQGAESSHHWALYVDSGIALAAGVTWDELGLAWVDEPGCCEAATRDARAALDLAGHVGGPRPSSILLATAMGGTPLSAPVVGGRRPIRPRAGRIASFGATCGLRGGAPGASPGRFFRGLRAPRASGRPRDATPSPRHPATFRRCSELQLTSEARARHPLRVSGTSSLSTSPWPPSFSRVSTDVETGRPSRASAI